MPLIKIKEGSIADSNTLNTNFDFLDKEIGENTFSKYSYDKTYNTGDYITVIENGFLTAFRSKRDENIGHDVSETDWWEKVNISSTGSFNMFDTKISDRVLTGTAALGWAMQGTYVYKNAILGKRIGYPDFYNACLKERTNASSHTVSLGGQSVVLYRSENGHEYYDIKDKAIIDTWFNYFGIADYYGIDVSSERVFLPRNIFYQQLTISQEALNTTHGSTITEMIEAGMHSHTKGSLSLYGKFPVDGWCSGEPDKYEGVFSLVSGPVHRNRISKISNDTAYVQMSANNGLYGETSYNGNHRHYFKNAVESTAITPPSCYKFLYYCVGNTMQNISYIDIVQEVEDGVLEISTAKETALSEIEAKRADLVSVSNNGIQSLMDQTTQSLTQINDSKQNAILEINDSKDGIIADIEQNTAHITEDFNANALIKTEEFDTNASEKQTLINVSVDNAKISETNSEIFAEGTDEQVKPLGGQHSARRWSEIAGEVVSKGIINDNIVSTATTYSSTKIEERLDKTKPVRLDIQRNPISPDEFYVSEGANEIRKHIYEEGRDVELSFDDVITNTGEQIYSYETFDKQGYAIFRRNVIDADTAERINIKVGNDAKVAFTTTSYDGILANGSKPMTGALKFDDSGYIERNNSPSTKGLALFGDKDGYGTGASIALRSNTASGSQAGAFKLETGNNITGHTHTLQGNPDGTIQWDGKELTNTDLTNVNANFNYVISEKFTPAGTFYREWRNGTVEEQGWVDGTTPSFGITFFTPFTVPPEVLFTATGFSRVVEATTTNMSLYVGIGQANGTIADAVGIYRGGWWHVKGQKVQGA